ncbi:MAG: NAD(P)-dependent oxidoreductase [Verrucomicrobiales bacterium]|nr:NAD(P)-dependent oxidoreductase [Verrucomicrobiales bacterium]
MQPAPQSIAELDDRASAPDSGVLDAVEKVDGPVLVAGAGGKMGYHLCRMLRKAIIGTGSRHEIIAVSRFGNPESRKPFEKESIRTISADLTDPEQVRSLPDAAAVFFLAGKKFGTGDDPDSLRLFNEEMPKFVADRYTNVPIIALSTGCVYPFVPTGSGGSVETDRVAPNGDYALSCVGRENAFLATSKEHGTPLSLIRLNYSVDLRYGVLVDIAHRVISGQPVDVSMGHLNCIWQGDAIRHTIRSLDLAKSAPEACILNVTGPQTLSVRRLAEDFADRFGKTVAITGEESEMAWLNNAAKSHALFGPPEISEDTLVDWVADWIQNARPLLGKPTHFEVRDGKY